MGTKTTKASKSKVAKSEKKAKSTEEASSPAIAPSKGEAKKTEKAAANAQAAVTNKKDKMANKTEKASKAEKNSAANGGPTPVGINIGIEDPQREAIAAGLSRLLADSYSLYLKTHNFHWNVTGPMFQTLHLLFETQYTELALAVDLIAERIRALGYPAPGTYSEYAKLTSIPETMGVPKAKEMIQLLMEGQEAVIRTARSIFPAADEVHDEPSADLLTQRMQVHEKNAWMLRSLLED